MPSDNPVDFGYRKVSPSEKTRLVGEVFERVARRYDVMNDLMSFGTHRIFKRMTIEMSGVRPGQRVLDLAGGTAICPRCSPMLSALMVWSSWPTSTRT